MLKFNQRLANQTWGVFREAGEGKGSLPFLLFLFFAHAKRRDLFEIEKENVSHKHGFFLFLRVGAEEANNLSLLRSTLEVVVDLALVQRLHKLLGFCATIGDCPVGKKVCPGDDDGFFFVIGLTNSC